MAEPDFNFDNCGTSDPPQITEIIFEVDGVLGTPDFDGFDGNDVSNPPMVGKTIEVIPTYINDDTTTEIITYRFFLSGSGTTVQSGSTYVIDDTVSAAGEQILCEVTVTNSMGSDTDTIDMGIIYGLPPVLPDDITTVATFSPSLNSVLQPGQSITVTYTSALTESGSPDLVSISTVVNGQEFTGSSFVYTVDGTEQSCQVTIQSVDISNLTNGIPNTGTDSRTYNTKIATVSDPVDGSACGTPLGRCCWTGGFDAESGTTFGNCDILTAADCATKGSGGGIWTEGELTCPDCDGSVGTPCCNDYGTGRCCCVQQDNSGLCVDGLTFGECNSGNFLFSQCGGSVEFPDIVWGHNLSCASSTQPPCVGPPTGRCCEVLLEGGTTCEIGLEELDCPRYLDSEDFVWSESGNCPDCADPAQNSGYPCCEPLGRCCLRGDNDDDGFEERGVEYNVTEARCSELVSEGGWDSGVWTQYNPGKDAAQSGLFVTCPDNTNSDCCVPVGRCCWKVGNVGNFQLNVTEEECANLAGSNLSQWLQGNNTTPDCNGNQLSTNLCCDTSIGRCCENNGVSNICNESVIFDDCDEAGQDFGRDQLCPECVEGVGAPCCNGDASITNVRFNPDPVIAGNSTTLQATISGDNFSSRRFEYYVDGILQQSSSPTTNAYTTGTNEVGLELRGVVSTRDLDGTLFSEEITTTINGEPPVLPTTLNISVSPGNNWPASLEPEDTITVSEIQTTDGNPDSTIEWQFESSTGLVLSSGSGSEPVTINYTVSASDVALEECGLKLRLTASNNSTEIPGTDSVSSVYPSPTGSWTVSGDPGDLCGVAIGRCCVTGDFDPTTGITSADCTNGVSEADCLAINGAWGGENSVCPTCDGSVGTPCCPEIGTGRCCCTQTDNTGLCIDGVTAGDCNVSNPDFAGCGDSPTGSPTWFHNQSCPNCADSIDPPCCAPQTGRCCEILPEGNFDGLPPGVTCAVGLEQFDCPRYSSSEVAQWTEDGICPNCTNPQDNISNPVCCPEKLGRCCCTTNADIFEGFCQANVTEAECALLCGSASQTWTENTSGDMPGGLQCPDCSDPLNELPCCNQRGRCCFKVEGDIDTPRLGRCFSGVTYGQCEFLRETSDPPAETEIFFREDNPPCPNCGAGNNTNACCDDVDIPFGICCTNGVCDDNNGVGVLQTDCTGAGQVFNDSTLVCPDCADPAQNEGQPCCPAGYPDLSIDQVLVNGTVYDESTNPIVPGSTLSVITTEQNVTNVQCTFTIEAASIDPNDVVLQTGSSKSYTVPSNLQFPGFTTMAGRNIRIDVSGTTPITELNPVEDTVDAGLINGIPFSFASTDPDQINQIVSTFPSTLPTVLGGSSLVAISALVGDGGAIPPATLSYEWLSSTESLLQSNGFYQVSSDGQTEGCSLKVKLILDNTRLSGVDIPGGARVEQIYNVGNIVAGGPDTLCSGDNLGTCCCGGVFDPSTGITGAECIHGITEVECNSRACTGGRQWTDDDYSSGGNFCPTNSQNLGGGEGLPCLPEYPTGRCCKSGVQCVDGVFQVDCDEANGFVWERDLTCPITPCESTDPAEQRCGCTEPPPATGACCCNGNCEEGYQSTSGSLSGVPKCGIGQFPAALICGGVGIPQYQGDGSSCPVCNGSVSLGLCCDQNTQEGPASNVVNIIGWSCSEVSSDPGNGDFCASFDSLIDPTEVDYDLISPCDFREITNSGDAGANCNIDKICRCYDPNPSGGPYCSGGPHINSTTEHNLVWMCEQRVCENDPFCCNGEWDSTCATAARILCTLSSFSTNNLISQSVETQMRNIINSYPDTGFQECGFTNLPCISEGQNWSSCKSILIS